MQHKRWRPAILVLALALATGGEYLLMLDSKVGGWALLAAALPLLIYALGRPSRQAPDAARASLWNPARLSLILLAVTGNLVALHLLWRDNTDSLGFILWLISLAGIILATPARPRTVRPVAHRFEIILLAIILLLALFLRLFDIQNLPPGIFIDETNAAIDALKIMDGEKISPFGTGWFETPMLYAYYMASLFRLVGVNLFTLKLLSILPGLLTVAGVYPLARRTFGPAPALISIFLLATTRWHIHMSRWGWNELLPPLFQVIVAYLLLRALEKANPRDFALAGLAIGLSQYTYLAARLVPVSIFFFLAHQALTVRGFLRRHAANILLLALVGLMSFAPLGLTYLKDPFLFNNRLSQVSLLTELEAANSLQPLWDNLFKHLRMFNDQGDPNPRHNLPGAPMLDPFIGALLPLAAAYALYCWRDRRYALLLLWIGVTLMGGIFSVTKEAPQAYRTLGALPPILILTGDLLARIYRRLSESGGRFRRIVIVAGLSVFLALSGYHNMRAYFVTYAQDPRVFWAFTPIETGIARAADAALDNRDVYIVPKLAHFSSLRFATYQSPEQGGGGLARPPYHQFFLLNDLALPSLSQRPALLILETQYLGLMPFLTRYYPEAIIHMHRAPDDQPLYITIEIPQRKVEYALPVQPPDQGLMGSYFQGESWQGQPIMQRLDPFLLFHWYDNDPLPNPFSVRWEGEIIMPVDGDYFFALVADDGIRFWLAGELVGESVRPDSFNVVESHRAMNAGRYSIRIEYFQRSGAKLIEFRWVRPGGSLELVPPEALCPAAGSE